jgi:hypothetical protein
LFDRSKVAWENNRTSLSFYHHAEF